MVMYIEGSPEKCDCNVHDLGDAFQNLIPDAGLLIHGDVCGNG